MVTVRCMTIFGDGSEILLALENTKNDKTCVCLFLCVCMCVCVCARDHALAQFWGKIFLLIFGMFADAIDFIQSPNSQH
jgi:hypothetical protein